MSTPDHPQWIPRWSISPRSQGGWFWYRVLACFKLGIVLEGTRARACAGKAPAGIGDRLHAHAIGLLTQARSLI